ncbi:MULTISPECIES: phosphopyruvate hydratase [Candidatus Ichthyocystis]|uniref:Enolase n=1 Tax=Candidatus Ichthyocystis hellenicum TaxID=1561003 RepID=A0A0S4LZI4_9BURK|nr:MULTISPECIES: phosphopyruvate hydratase [Ichthyocystis]CUT16985.1 Enolase [Candidatus Ichthyocystis hellenicum]
MPHKIADVRARQILDSRGNPTVEADVVLDSGIVGRASVPSGASTGIFEACEWRDGDMNYYQGKSVQGAVEHIRGEIRDALLGMDPSCQVHIDRLLVDLDHSKGKARLGANALLAISLAVSRAAAAASNLPLTRYIGGCGLMQLPVPLMNIINGGVHADNGLPFQEMMIVPVCGDYFRDALHCGVLIFQSLKTKLREIGLSFMVGDEGGFAPHLSSIEQGLSLLMDAMHLAGFEPGRDVWIALDCASSQFFSDCRYKISGDELSSSDFSSYLVDLCGKFPIVSIEDGMAESDWEGWQLLTQRLGDTVQLVGDDLFVTQASFLRRGIDTHSANAILLKLNQVGTLTETFETFFLARRSGYGTVVSHRSGETSDSFIADLSVAWSAGQIKAGAPCRADRTSKYNQLIRIEEDLGESCYFSGKTAFSWLKN